MRPRVLSAALPLLASAALLAGCGGGRDGGEAADTRTGGTDSNLSGSIQADGSSTVGPFATAAAERFQREHSGVRITVGVSGTGGGFERFCRGETDVSNASRPIEAEETQVCEKDGVEFVELHVANDALTVIVNRGNDWASCLTVAELKRIWEPGSKIERWNRIRPQFPDEELVLAGPGTDSGTFDYFTDVIVGEEGASRSDYTASENDNVIVQAISGERGGLGYLGFSYLEDNQDKLKAVAIDSGSGCVEPSVATAQDGTYKPLARPLFMYVTKESLARPEVAAFLRFTLDNATEIAGAARFVPLTDEQVAKAHEALDRAAGSG